MVVIAENVSFEDYLAFFLPLWTPNRKLLYGMEKKVVYIPNRGMRIVHSTLQESLRKVLESALPEPFFKSRGSLDLPVEESELPGGPPVYVQPDISFEPAARDDVIVSRGYGKQTVVAEIGHSENEKDLHPKCLKYLSQKCPAKVGCVLAFDAYYGTGRNIYKAEVEVKSSVFRFWCVRRTTFE
jgi:hypothetical protein